MNRALVTRVHVESRLFVFGLMLFSTLLFPIGASAAEISVQNAQILPASALTTEPASTSCVDLQVESFTLFVHNGELDSFEVNIPDRSYVVVGGSLNEKNIPLNFVTRYTDVTGGVRMHVDVPSVPVGNGVSIMLTMLSAKGVGQPVCASAVTIAFSGNGGAPVKSAAASNSNWQRERDNDQVSAVSQEKKETTFGSTATGSVTVLTTRLQNTLNETCAIPGAASRLWTVLLALYLLVVAAAILAQPPFKIDTRSYVFMGATIVIPLLVLFTIWKISPLCHPGKWVPLFTILIALIGFVAGFRRHPSFKNLLRTLSFPET